MQGRFFSAFLLSVLILAGHNVHAFAAISIAVSQPLKLKIYVGPPKVLADNNAYDSIFVQLQDSKGVPFRASENVIIHLSSSLTHIGSVDPLIPISSGSTYAVAKFYSTYTPGTTTITATASGFATVQESITTVGPVPSKLELYCLPPSLPADGEGYRSIVVQLQDSAGSPAKAPIGDVNVTLSCSNVTVGTVGSFVVISAGKTYEVAMFYTTEGAGSAVVTAIASGYLSGQTQVVTQNVGGVPTRLKVYVGPPKVPADGVVYEQVAVQLQDLTGRIARATGDVAVALSSSNTGVGTVESATTIGDGATCTVTKFYSTFRSGSTVVTAVATDYTSGKETVATVGPVPVKLAVYCAPSSLPADGRSYEAIIVQLQDSSGTPAKDSVGDVNIGLFSSAPETGNAEANVTISFGKTDSVAAFYSQYAAGPTTITAITAGYASGQAVVSTFLIDLYELQVSVSAYPDSVESGEQTTIRVYATYGGLSPTLGATIRLTSDKGGNFSLATDERNGYYLSLFKAPDVTTQTVCTVTANVSKSGYVGGLGTVQVAVTTTVSAATLHIYVKETPDSPVSEVSVTSTSQPTGISSLSGTTDSQGFLSFEQILAGSYTIKVERSGYETKAEDVEVQVGQTTNCTIIVAKLPLNVLGLPLLTFVLMIVVVIILIGSITLYLHRRRKKKAEPQADESKATGEEGTESDIAESPMS